MISGEECYRRYLYGDDKALGEIVDIYNRNLILFITSVTGDFSGAEDIAADTFLDLIIKKPVFRGESSFKTWLFRIARNKAIDAIRKNKHSAIPVDSIPEKESDEKAEDELLTSERDKMLYRSINSLPQSYKEVLQLIYFGEASYAEAAAVMKKNVKQINNLAYRARTALKNALEKEGFVYEEQ